MENENCYLPGMEIRFEMMKSSEMDGSGGCTNIMNALATPEMYI